MRYDNVTFMMTLPRSRSAWLCRYLEPAAITFHDLLATCDSIDELGRIIDSTIRVDNAQDYPLFVADTSAVLFHAQIMDRFPGARYLFVYRDLNKVYESLWANGMRGLTRKRLRSWRLAQLDAWTRCNSRQEFRYDVQFDLMNTHLHNLWRFIGARTLFDQDYTNRMILKHVSIPAAVQAEHLNPAKVAKLFRSIGLDYVG